MKRREFCGAALLWPGFAWGHAGHSHSALKVTVRKLQRDGTDVRVWFDLENRSKSPIVISEAFVFGSEVRQQRFPLPIAAQAKQPSEVVLRFKGAVPDTATLILLHKSGGQTDVALNLTPL